MRDDVQLFVYGSCHFSEGPDSNEVVGNGGYGVVVMINGKKEHEFSGGFSNTTNARMDLFGIAEGLKQLERPGHVTVYLANGYIIDALTKGWLEKWQRNGYRKIKHADLWQALHNMIHSSPITITARHSKAIKHAPEFQLAEQLGKAMSGKRNLPGDLKPPPAADVFSNTGITTDVFELTDDEPIPDSICVDASSLQNPGITEYRGIDTRTGKVIFERRYEEATNNIGEFLAIVLALAYCQKQGSERTVIYS